MRKNSILESARITGEVVGTIVGRTHRMILDMIDTIENIDVVIEHRIGTISMTFLKATRMSLLAGAIGYVGTADYRAELQEQQWIGYEDIQSKACSENLEQ